MSSNSPKDSFLVNATHRIVGSLMISFLALGILTVLLDLSSGVWAFFSIPLCAIALGLILCIFNTVRDLPGELWPLQ